MAWALTPTKTFHMVKKTWTHFQHNKSDISAINLISPLQKQYGMIYDQIQHIRNNTSPIQPNPN
jgi:hypothetical protein